MSHIRTVSALRIRAYRKSALRIRCKSGGMKRSARPSFYPMLLPTSPIAFEMRPPNRTSRTSPMIRMCQMLRPNILASRSQRNYLAATSLVRLSVRCHLRMHRVQAFVFLRFPSLIVAVSWHRVHREADICQEAHSLAHRPGPTRCRNDAARQRCCCATANCSNNLIFG